MHHPQGEARKEAPAEWKRNATPFGGAAFLPPSLGVVLFSPPPSIVGGAGFNLGFSTIIINFIFYLGL